MEHPVLTLGDTDASVARGILALTNARETLDEGTVERPRAVLAFADLREHSRQSGKERLRASCMRSRPAISWSGPCSV